MDTENPKKSVFFRLYNNVYLKLYGYFLTIVHNQNDAEDLLQETATILWEKFDQFEEGTNFGAWALQIARFKAMEFMRKNKKTRMFFGEEFYDTASHYAEQASSDVSDRSEALQLCLKKLSETNIKLLSMRYKKGIPLKRLSTLTGRSKSGLCQSFSKILGGLRLCMERYLAQKDL